MHRYVTAIFTSAFNNVLSEFLSCNVSTLTQLLDKLTLLFLHPPRFPGSDTNVALMQQRDRISCQESENYVGITA